MAIRSDLSVRVLNDKAALNNKIHIFRNDRGIDLYFDIVNFPFLISKLETPVREAGATVLKPSNQEFEIDKLELVENKIKFTITHEMTDELQEIGTYKLHIHLYDELDNRITVPYIDFTVNPLVTDTIDNVARVDSAIVGTSVVSDEIELFSVQDGYIKTIWQTGDVITATKLNKIETTLEEHANALKELLFVPIAINSLTLSKTIAERGESISNLVVNWSLNKEPLTQMLDGVSIGTSLRTFTNPTVITSNKTFSLSVTDERGNASRSASVNFYNGRYHGVSSSSSYNNELILSLTKTLTDNRANTFSVNCGVGQYIFFAIPSRLGTPTFTVGGFSGGFSKVSTIAFTNNFSYTENYDIWKSTNSNLGSTTVIVG